jgi:exopolysaccharide production protein ExoQ
LRFAKSMAVAEFVFAILGLSIFMGAFVHLLVAGTDVADIRGAELWTDEKKDVLRGIYAPIYGISCLWLLPHLAPTWTAVKASWHVWLLILWACLSIGWSIDPDTSLRRSFALLFTSIFAVGLALRFDVTRMLRLLVATCASLMLLSFVFIVLFPSLGLQSNEFAWRGVMFHKNQLGRAMLLSIFVFLIVEARSTRMRILRWISIISAVVLMWFSQSRGPLVILLALTPLALLIWSFRFSIKLRALVCSAVITMSFIVGSVLFLGSDSILGILERDASLTGRTELWPLVLGAISDRPLLGFGFDAFWPSEALFIWDIVKWIPTNAHDGFLDLWLSLGIIGLLLFLLSVALNCRVMFIALKKGRVLEAKWCISYVILFISSNLTESPLVDANSTYWILYVVATIQASSATLRRPQAQNWHVEWAPRGGHIEFR